MDLTPGGDILVGKEQNDIKRLREEIAQCKADKEFVWLLWKQLQQESPDITTAVELVVSREKVKQDRRDEEAAMILDVKDQQITTLQNVMTSQCDEVHSLTSQLQEANTRTASLQQELNAKQSEAESNKKAYQEALEENEKVKRRCSQLELADKGNKIEVDVSCQERERLDKELVALKTKLRSKEVDQPYLKSRISSLTSAFSVSNEKCVSLQEDLKKKEVQLAKMEAQHRNNDSTTSQLKKELEDVSKSRDHWANQNTAQTTLIEKLQTEIENLNTALASEKQRNEIPLKMTDQRVLDSEPQETSHFSLANLSHKSSSGELNLMGVSTLQNTERELVDTRTQLQAKTEELQCLRCSHDKRLGRMRALKTQYQLVVEQLKTYEKHKSPLRHRRKPVKRRRHSESGLKHESSERVWNELAEYRSLHQEMEKQMLFLEEERDTFQARCLRNQTTISELRACLQHEESDLERKIAAIAVLEGSVHNFNRQEQKLVEFEQYVGVLEKEKKQLHDKCNDMEKTCSVFRQERVDFESTILHLKHESEMKILTSLCKSTMTDPLKHSDKGNGPLSPALTRLSMNVKQAVSTQDMETESKIGRKSPTGLIRHKRSRSDGEVLMNQRKQVQFLPSTRMILCPSKHAPFSRPERIPAPHISQSIKKSNQKSSQQRSSKCKVMVSTASQTNYVLEKQDRKFATENHLKCDLQRKVKNLEQRLQSALKQVTCDHATRRTMTHCLEEQKRLTEKFRDENRELSKRLQGCRASLKAVEEERHKTVESLDVLQERLKRLEETNSKADEGRLRRLEKEKMELQGKCSELRASVRSLQHELQARVADLTLARDVSEKLERDLKQKRLLIDEYQSKLKTAKESSSTDMKKIQSLKEDMKRLTDSCEQSKNRAQVFKAQLAQQSSDKDQLVEVVEKCRDELQKNVQQLSDCRECNDNKLKAAHNLFQKKNNEMEISLGEQLSVLETQLQEKSDIVNEFKAACEGFAFELEKEFHHLCQTVEKPATSQKSDGLSARIREIARSTLQLSDHDIDDLFSETEDKADSEQVFNGDAPLVKAIVNTTKGYTVPFAEALTTLMINYVHKITNHSQALSVS